MPESEHTKIITRAARAALTQIGCRQKGRSRSWIDDHQWWIVKVEFQPSGWSKGSYLNVGASWLWDGKAHSSFDEGYRIQEFVPFQDAAQFEREMQKMAERARDEVLKLGNRFPSLAAVAASLDAKPNLGSWNSLHAGISSGLVGNVDAAQGHFLRLAAEVWDRSSTMYSTRPDGTRTERTIHVPEPEWYLNLKSRAKEYADLVSDREAFLAAISANIQVSRKAAKLPEIDAAKFLVDEVGG